ncbi:MAG TPA: hypothetical protein VFH99_03790 [Candidatus Saccharimonadales bacterium]|nr:hypothetical protein [Candidatus Saccharimonadales bacterium]
MNEFVQAPVAENVEHAISKIRNEDGGLEAGNVLRRFCEWAGEGACEQVCQLSVETTTSGEVAAILAKKACADLNLVHAFNELGLEPKDVLVVGVTANNVGFVDQLDDYDKLTQNPHGWRELPGFNAFFAREGEVDAIGRRLADCADINIEFTDSEGNTVFGFEHGTRTDMFGSSAYAFEKGGKKMSFTEYALSEAIDHYGADPSSINIKLAAAIKGHNFTKHFNSREQMEEHLPGWYDDGFVKNVSNPDWRPGDPLVADDTWEADTRGMILRDIHEAMNALAIPGFNLSTEGIIDPGDSRGVHSSHQFADTYGESRDLYITYIK